MEEILGYLTALGLSTAAGLNAWIPLLATGLLARYTGLIDLTGDWDVLEQPIVLIAIAGVGALDFVGDKIPAVDHVLHGAGTVIAPVTGIVASLAATGDLDTSSAVVAILGLASSEGAHATRMAIRPLSTAGTGGVGNPILSLIEDGISAVLSIFAIALPVIALLLVIAFFVAAWRIWSRLRAAARGGGRRPATGAPG
jgi:hypothetical protein